MCSGQFEACAVQFLVCSVAREWWHLLNTTSCTVISVGIEWGNFITCSVQCAVLSVQSGHRRVAFYNIMCSDNSDNSVK